MSEQPTRTFNQCVVHMEVRYDKPCPYCELTRVKAELATVRDELADMKMPFCGSHMDEFMGEHWTTCPLCRIIKLEAEQDAALAAHERANNRADEYLTAKHEMEQSYERDLQAANQRVDVLLNRLTHIERFATEIVSLIKDDNAT